MKQNELKDFTATVRADCVRWLDTIRYGQDSIGLFRSSRHAYHPWCLYASVSALAVHGQLDLLEELTPADKQAWADVFLKNYHPELGLFLCPQLYGPEFKGDPGNYEDRLRAEGAAPFKKMAGAVYRLTGSVPLTPDEGTLGCNDCDELERFFEEKRREQNPYGFGSTIGDFFHKRNLWLRGRKLDPADDPWIKWGYTYIDRVRDADTGLMTGAGGDAAAPMNGLFKLSCASFWNHGVPMPRARRVIDTVLTLASPENGFGRACEDYNATRILCRLSRQEQGYRLEDILRAAAPPVLNRLEQRRQPDGGFSFFTEHCQTHVNGYPLCDPLPESDLFGTNQQLAILGELQSLTA